MAFTDTSFLYDNVTGINSFTITQPFLGAPLEFSPALGTRELDELVDAYVISFAPWHEKLSDVTIDFYKYATVDLSTGALVRTYNIFPVPYATSPTLDFNLPMFTPSPSSDYSSSFTSHTPPAKTPKARSSRVTKKPAKETKATSTARLPGFSIMTRDGVDVTTSAGRGTKTKEQREHAHLMRIMKACDACKRKKVRCDPAHRRTDAELSSPAFTTATSSMSCTSSSNSSPSNTDPYNAFLANSPQSSQSSQFSTPSFSSSAMDDFVLFPRTPPLGSNSPNPPLSLTRGQLNVPTDTAGLSRSQRPQTDISNVWAVPRGQGSNLQDISSHLLSNPQQQTQQNVTSALQANVQRNELFEFSTRSSTGEVQRTTSVDHSSALFEDNQGTDRSDPSARLSRGQRTDLGDGSARSSRGNLHHSDLLSTTTSVQVSSEQRTEHSDTSVFLSRNRLSESGDTSTRDVSRSRRHHAEIFRTSPATVNQGERIETSDVATNLSRSPQTVSGYIPRHTSSGERQSVEPLNASPSLSSSSQGNRISDLAAQIPNDRGTDSSDTSLRSSRNQPSILSDTPARLRTERQRELQDILARLEQNQRTDAVDNLKDRRSRVQATDPANNPTLLQTEQQKTLTELHTRLLKSQRPNVSSDGALLSSRENVKNTESPTPLPRLEASDSTTVSSHRPTTSQSTDSPAISISLSLRQRCTASGTIDSPERAQTINLSSVLLRFAKSWAFGNKDIVSLFSGPQTSKCKLMVTLQNSKSKHLGFGAEFKSMGMSTQSTGLAAFVPLRSLVGFCWKALSSNIRPLTC